MAPGKRHVKSDSKLSSEVLRYCPEPEGQSSILQRGAKMFLGILMCNFLNAERGWTGYLYVSDSDHRRSCQSIFNNHGERFISPEVVAGKDQGVHHFTKNISLAWIDRGNFVNFSCCTERFFPVVSRVFRGFPSAS